MLPRALRLKREDIGFIKNIKKKTASSEYFFLKIYGANFSPSRFAVVVPSSISKKAVQRNKIKRRVRGAILRNTEKLKDELAVIIYPQKETAVVGKKLEEKLMEVFKKGGILK